MKKALFVIALFSLLHESSLFAQEPLKIQLETGIFKGASTATFSNLADTELNGELDYAQSKSHGLNVGLRFSKRFSLQVAYLFEKGEVQKTIGRSEPNALDFFSLIFLGNDDFNWSPGVPYTTTLSVRHTQAGAQYAWVSRPYFQMYSGLGLGFASGSAQERQHNGDIKLKKFSGEPAVAVTPIGMRAGKRVYGDLAFGLVAAPSFRAGVGVRF